MFVGLLVIGALVAISWVTWITKEITVIIVSNYDSYWVFNLVTIGCAIEILDRFYSFLWICQLDYFFWHYNRLWSSNRRDVCFVKIYSCWDYFGGWCISWGYISFVLEKVFEVRDTYKVDCARADLTQISNWIWQRLGGFWLYIVMLDHMLYNICIARWEIFCVNLHRRFVKGRCWFNSNESGLMTFSKVFSKICKFGVSAWSLLLSFSSLFSHTLLLDFLVSFLL